MTDVPQAKHGKQTRAIEADVINSWLNAEYQRKIEELQFNAQKNLDEMKVQNKKAQDSLLEHITRALSKLKVENKKMQELLLKQDKNTASAVEQASITKRDFSKVKRYNCGALGHTSKICRKPKQTANVVPTAATLATGNRVCFGSQQLRYFKKDCPGQKPKPVQDLSDKASCNVCTRGVFKGTEEAYIELIIGGRSCICLLDTASDATPFSSLVKGYMLVECAVGLHAANETKLNSSTT